MYLTETGYTLTSLGIIVTGGILQRGKCYLSTREGYQVVPYPDATHSQTGLKTYCEKFFGNVSMYIQILVRVQDLMFFT
jgi:hypothetical protein